MSSYHEIIVRQVNMKRRPIVCQVIMKFEQDIPNDGWDQWFEISKGKKSRKCGVTGHLRLKLQVSAKHVRNNIIVYL